MPSKNLTAFISGWIAVWPNAHVHDLRRRKHSSQSVSSGTPYEFNSKNEQTNIKKKLKRFSTSEIKKKVINCSVQWSEVYGAKDFRWITWNQRQFCSRIKIYMVFVSVLVPLREQPKYFLNYTFCCSCLFHSIRAWMRLNVKRFFAFSIGFSSNKCPRRRLPFKCPSVFAI